MSKKVFVTGATGFIGSNLVRKLYKLKKDITIFVPKNFTHPFLKGLKIKRKDGDIRDYNSVLKAMSGCDYVYHLAALTMTDQEKKKEVFDVNVLGTENIMKASLKLGIKKVVYVSSTSVLGFSNNERIKLTEKDNLQFEDSIYSQSKKFAEDKVQEYVAKGLNATIVVPCSVIGAGAINPLVGVLIKNISNQRIKFTFPGGTSFVAVGDVVDGMILAMKKGKVGQRYILNGGYARYKETYNQIAEILKKPKIKLELPRISYYPMYFLAAILQKIFKKLPITTALIKGGYSYRIYDSTKAQMELGWKPKITFDEAIRQAINYYRGEGML